jgi:DNA polymerase-1
VDIYVFDLEADGFLEEATKVHCAVFKKLGTNSIYKFTPKNIDKLLDFMDKADVLIGHNVIGYDFPLLKKLYGYEYKGKKVDTLIMSRLLDPKRQSPPNCPNKKAPHSVEAWGYRVSRGKPEHEDWENFSEDMLHRCTEDTEIQELIYKELLKEAKGGAWRNAFLLTFKLFENLQLQEQYGWKVDRPYMDECIQTLTRWIGRIDKVISPRLPNILEVNETKIKGEYKYVAKPFLKSGAYSKSVLDWFNLHNIPVASRIVAGPFTRVSFRKVDLDSRLEVIDFLLKLGWEPLEYNYSKETGEPTSPKLSKDDPFEGITDKLGKLVAKRIQCKHRRSSIEGFKKLIRTDGAIPSRVTNLAVTGRATHGNIVNIPRPGSFFGKQMRKIFIAREGKVIVGTDSDSCQVRMLAGRMGNKDYIDAVINGDKSKGTDNHSMTMKICDLDSRDTAKTTLYCLMFGGGDTKLGKSAKKPGKGAEIRKLLYKGLTGLEELLERLSAEWRSTAKRRFNAKFNKMEYYNGTVVGLDGRPIRIASEHQILVYMLQSDESIMMAAAYNLAAKRLAAKYEYGKQYGFLIWMHDEIQIECDPDIAEDVGKTVARSISDAGAFFNIQCPHIGDYSIGVNWAETH